MQVNKAIQEPQATQFLYNNHYGWFNKVERGVYKISDKGKQELLEWQEKVKSTVHINYK